MHRDVCKKCGSWLLAAQHTCPPHYLCREEGRVDWYRISPSQASTAEDAAIAYAGILDATPRSRFMDRVIEVRRSDSEEITLYSIALDFQVTYMIERLA
jgi:hypothetical protein